MFLIKCTTKVDCNNNKKQDKKGKRTAAAAATTAAITTFRRVSFFQTFVSFGMALLSTLKNPYTHVHTLEPQTPKSNDKAFNKKRAVKLNYGTVVVAAN